MSQYFPPYNNSSENIKIELDLSNYATKKDIKDITHVDTSIYALKTNLAALKTEVDNVGTDKLKTVPNDLSKLSNVVENDVVKKTEYNTLKKRLMLLILLVLLQGIDLRLMLMLQMVKLIKLERKYLILAD